MTFKDWRHKPHTQSKELAERWPLVNEFDLSVGDTAIVAGAYKGAVMRLLWDKYGCRVVGFEPQLWAVNEAYKLTDRSPMMHLYPYGLGTGTEMLTMGEFHTDACGVQRTTRDQGQGVFVEAVRALHLADVYTASLFVCNMEGYEYELLPYLHHEQMLRFIDSMAIQFHRDLGNDHRHDEILSMLEETHVLDIREGKAWDYWVKKPLA